MYTLRAAREAPLLLVGTYRSDDLTRRHPLRPFLAEVMRLPSTEVIELERLDAAAVAQLVAEILGGRPPPGIVDDVYGRCGGNPFLVEEVIAAGVDGAGRLSPRLQDILLARTASLSPEAPRCCGSRRSVARGSTIACCGASARCRLRRSMAPYASYSIATSSSQTARAAVTSSGTRSPPRRCMRMLCLASGCASTPPSPTPSARIPTWPPPVEPSPRSSAPGTGTAPARAPRRSRRGLKPAAAAERVYAYPEALAAYENALELWPTIEDARALAGLDEVELLHRAAEAAHRAGPLARALTLGQSALALVDERKDPLRAAMLAERLGRYSWASGREADALAYYQRAVELAPEQPASAERARALAGHAQILMLNWRDTAAARLAQEAIEAARQVGAIAVEAHALNTLAMAKCWTGRRARRAVGDGGVGAAHRAQRRRRQRRTAVGQPGGTAVHSLPRRRSSRRRPARVCGTA